MFEKVDTASVDAGNVSKRNDCGSEESDAAFLDCARRTLTGAVGKLTSITDGTANEWFKDLTRRYYLADFIREGNGNMMDDMTKALKSENLGSIENTEDIRSLAIKKIEELHHALPANNPLSPSMDDDKVKKAVEAFCKKYKINFDDPQWMTTQHENPSSFLTTFFYPIHKAIEHCDEAVLMTIVQSSKTNWREVFRPFPDGTGTRTPVQDYAVSKRGVADFEKALGQTVKTNKYCQGLHTTSGLKAILDAIASLAPVDKWSLSTWLFANKFNIMDASSSRDTGAIVSHTKWPLATAVETCNARIVAELRLVTANFSMQVNSPIGGTSNYKYPIEAAIRCDKDSMYTIFRNLEYDSTCDQAKKCVRQRHVNADAICKNDRMC